MGSHIRPLLATALATAGAGAAVFIPAFGEAAPAPAPAPAPAHAGSGPATARDAGAAATGHEPTGATAAVLPAGGRGSGPAPAPGRVLRLEAHLLVGEEVDLGAPGRSAGDEFVFSGDLRQAGGQTDRVIGRFGGYCVITDPARNAGQCSSTAVLPDGQITVQGEQTGIPTPAPVTNAVTGGTGAHCTARGQMRQRLVTPSVWELVFQLTDGPACAVDPGGGTPGGK